MRQVTIRVCHPGPEACHFSSTKTGSRSEINLRVPLVRGLPRLRTTARDRDSSVSSGSSSYSRRAIRCWSSLRRLDFKEGGEAGFFTLVGLSHAEDVAGGTSDGVADHDQSAHQYPKTNDPLLTVRKPQIFQLHSDALKDDCGILEIQTPLVQRTVTLCWIVGDTHLLYIQKE